MTQTLKGVYVPLATALTEKENLDETGMRRLIRLVLEGGVHGLISGGSTGEFFGLSPEKRRLLLEIVLEEVKGRVPVYAGTGAITTRETVQLTRQAQDAGADGALILTPFYISPTQEDLYNHYMRIAGETDLPIIIYSNPARTGGVYPSPETIARLSEITNIVALKDSSGNLALLSEYVRQTKETDFFILMGQDKHFYAGLLHGCTGLVAATANVAPRLLVDLYHAFVEKDLERCLSLQEGVRRIREGFEALPFPVAAKAMIKLAGVDVGPAFAPLGRGREIPPDILARLKEIVDSVAGTFI